MFLRPCYTTTPAQVLCSITEVNVKRCNYVGRRLLDFLRWAHSAGRKDNVRALQLFQEWVSERITDTVRCCEPQDVMQMPLVFRDKRSFTMDLLDENRRPDPPSPDFCVNHDLKGTFFALDFPVLSTWDSPQDMTIRYHGTNLYALSAAMAAGILVRAQEGRLCCTAGAVARPPPQPGIA